MTVVHLFSAACLCASANSPLLAAAPAEGVPPVLKGDYWIAPMRKVHCLFQGKPGTLAQYGDSITVTMAFLAPFTWQKRIQVRNCPPRVQRTLDLLTAYADRTLWRKWKGGQFGNTGMMTSQWFVENVKKWQARLTPEVAVIMFGTNDIGRIPPERYKENMRRAIQQILTGGTIPILTTIPPCHRGSYRPYAEAVRELATELSVPLIDYQAEILKRRPTDWDGALPKFKAYRGYQVPTLISRDGTHPSNPKEYMYDFGAEALSKNGYTLRNYLTLCAYAEVIRTVLKPPQSPSRKK